MQRAPLREARPWVAEGFLFVRARARSRSRPGVLASPGGGCRGGVRKKLMIVCHRGVYTALTKGEGAARLVVPD